MSRLSRSTCPLCNNVSKGSRVTAEALWHICVNCGLLWDPDVALTTGDIEYAKRAEVPAQWTHDYRTDRVLAGETDPWKFQWDDIENMTRPFWKKPPTSFLEIGHGGGEILDYLREKYPQAAIRGYETEPNAVAFTRSRGHDTHMVDVSNPPDDEPTLRTFDIVFANEVMEHILDPGKFISSLKKYAHEDTLLWLKFAHPDIPVLEAGEWYYWPFETAKKALQTRGWEVLKSRTAPTYHAFVARKAK